MRSSADAEDNWDWQELDLDQHHHHKGVHWDTEQVHQAFELHNTINFERMLEENKKIRK